MKVEYSHNNSGGHWWLEDKDWLALEKAGWIVKWFKNNKMYRVDKNGRSLGALATSACREGLSLGEAVDEWEEITNQNALDAGCPCCGQPHMFTEYDDDGKFVSSGPTVDYSCSW